MGGTIIHTQAKEFIAKTGKNRSSATSRYGPKIGKSRKETDYDQFLHWTTRTDCLELVKKQSDTVEELIKVLSQELDSKTGLHGLSLNTADSAAREAGFKGGKELTEAIDRAGACLVARIPDKYMFKGDLVLSKKP